MAILTKEALSAVTDRLVTLGLRKCHGGIFTMPMGDDVIGWVGLNKAIDRSEDAVVLNPVVGLRNQRVERLVAELSHVPFDELSPPTISTNVGYLQPVASYQRFAFSDQYTVEMTAGELVESVSEFGLPFMRRNVELPELLVSLESNRFAPRHQAIFRIPAVLFLLGRTRETKIFLEKEMNALNGRRDAAALTFANFGNAFLLRMK